jgi:imidazolonepropionase-like amidohydrolase
VSESRPRIIFAGTLIDGTGKAPVKDAAVVIDEAGAIAYAGSAREVPLGDIPADRQLDARDGTLLPGLIDSHVHLTFNTRTQATSPAVIHQLVTDDDCTLAMRAVQAAHACLGAGITTVRDCGARGLVVLRLRDLIDAGVIHGPRILACGMPITTTAGHCNWCGLRADNEPEAVLATRRMVEAGADFIKVMATGGGMTVGSNICEPQYSIPELAAIAREAHRLGRKVTAHSHAPSGQHHCVEAGIDMIEHCNWYTADGQVFDADLMRRLIDAGMYVGITLSGPQQQEAAAATPIAAFDAALQQRYEILHRMREMGAMIVLHSDAIAPITVYEDFPWSLVAAVAYGGFSPVEAIHAVTGRAAEAIGIDGQTGTVETGKAADLLVVDGDAATDVRAVTRTRNVLRGGRIVAGSGWVRTSPSSVIPSDG